MRLIPSQRSFLCLLPVSFVIVRKRRSFYKYTVAYAKNNLFFSHTFNSYFYIKTIDWMLQQKSFCFRSFYKNLFRALKKARNTKIIWMIWKSFWISDKDTENPESEVSMLDSFCMIFVYWKFRQPCIKFHWIQDIHKKFIIGVLIEIFVEIFSKDLPEGYTWSTSIPNIDQFDISIWITILYNI